MFGLKRDEIDMKNIEIESIKDWSLQDWLLVNLRLLIEWLLSGGQVHGSLVLDGVFHSVVILRCSYKLSTWSLMDCLHCIVRSANVTHNIFIN